MNCRKPGFRRRYGDAEKERDCIAVIDELTAIVCGTVTQICVEETARGDVHE
ncbi:MAG: hypothetical protein JW820_05380 [Spirochaetales bacterium]|nr:hypothetical protein [Spirochaetales bacterium]